MASSLSVANEANDFLDSINADSPIPEGRLEKLQELKAQMILYGFNAPFSALVARTKAEAIEPSAEEVQDQKKHAKFIRYIASLKKFTLNRIRAAISAHKLAIALADAGKPNFIRYLPLNGAYKQMLTEEGELAAESYRTLLSIFEQKRYPMRTASALIGFMQDGVEVERTIQLDANKDAKQSIENMFGKEATVKDVVLKKKSAGLIRNYSTKVSLFTMASICASISAKRLALEEEKKNERLAKYNSILRANKLVPDIGITETERFENVKQEMLKEGFLQKKLGRWLMDEEFEALLYRRRNQKRKSAMEFANLEVYRLLQWYYICMHADARKSYFGMPSVLAEPDEAHLAVLSELAPPNYPISHPPKLISGKLKMEEGAPPIPSRFWGPAYLCVKENLDKKWVCKELNIPETELENAISMVKNLVEKPSGRGAQFLESLKGERE